MNNVRESATILCHDLEKVTSHIFTSRDLNYDMQKESARVQLFYKHFLFPIKYLDVVVTKNVVVADVVPPDHTDINIEKIREVVKRFAKEHKLEWEVMDHTQQQQAA